MNRALLQTVLRQAAHSGPDVPHSDAVLLQRYARNGDHAAFAELVLRHGPMVWAVCRQMLSNPADAEDAFQATFLALVKSARTVRATGSLGGWLHGVAVKASLKVNRSAIRRKQRERVRASGEADSPVPDSAWDAMLAAVHEEVQKLPETLRTVFVLCDLEGVRQPDAAARLGWKPGTLTGRLTKARQRLLERLAKRGIAPLAIGGLGIGTACAAAAVPRVLCDSVLSLAACPASAGPALLSLATEVLPMTVNRTKLLVAALLVAGGLTMSFGPGLFPTADAQQPGSGGPGGAPGLPGGAGGGPGGLGGSPGRAGGGTPGASGNQFGGSMGSGSSLSPTRVWEFRYSSKPATPLAFAKRLSDFSSEGWEFTGSVEFVTPADLIMAAKSDPVQFGSVDPSISTLLVFKRLKAISGVTGAGSSRNDPLTGRGSSIPAPVDPTSTRLFRLRNVAAVDVAKALSEAIKGSDFRVTAEPLTNSVLVAGSSKDFQTVEKLLEQLDLEPKPIPPQPRATVFIPLKHARAADVSVIVGQLFNDRNLRIQTDERTNNVILVGDAATIKEVQAVIEKLDAPVPKK